MPQQPRIFFKVLTEPPQQPKTQPVGGLEFSQPRLQDYRAKWWAVALAATAGAVSPVVPSGDNSGVVASANAIVPYSRTLLYPAIQQPVPVVADVSAYVSFDSVVPYSGFLIYPAVQAPVPISTAETVTVDKWIAPLGHPTRLTARLQQFATGAFVEAAPFPETISADRWQQALSEPVRRRGQPSQQQTASFFIGSDTSRDARSFSPLSEPVRRRGTPISQQPSLAFVEAAPFAETVSVDRWQQPISQPTLRKRTIQPDGFSWSYLAPADVSAFVSFESIVPYSGYLIYPAVQGAVPFVSVAETITADKWFVPPSQPTRRKATIQPDGLSLSYTLVIRGDIAFATSNSIVPYARTLLYPAVQQPVVLETITVDKWFAPASQPVLPKKGLPAHRQLGFTAPSFVPAPSVTSWFVTLSGPLQPLYRGLASYEQRSPFFVKASQFAESVTADRWFQPLYVPVRRKVSVAYHPSEFWGATTPTAAIIGALDNQEDFVLYTAEIELWFLTDRES